MGEPKILIVEDDPALLKFLRANLVARGYNTNTAMDGVKALEEIEKDLPELVLLDINLPRMNGLEVCKKLREWTNVPILVISARGDESDKVTCLDLGADDYLTKPFGIEELLARIRAIFRRSKTTDNGIDHPTFVSGSFIFNFAYHRVIVSGNEIDLTPTEYNTLRELVKNADRVLTQNMLLGKVWGPEYIGSREYLHVIINRLRKKIEPDMANPTFIQTVPGVGYRFQSY
ncbi:MAG: response regulator transcription factor [Dehalococcoidia bacterium]|jgi:DNA-binding response OmpR family regulator